MKTFSKSCAQGDVLIRRVDSLPVDVKELAASNGEVIVTHSETGHHHVMVLDREAEPNVRMFQGSDDLLAWLKIDRPTALEHRRDFDTHEPIMFPPGVYEVRRQGEYTPEGWRRVAD